MRDINKRRTKDDRFARTIDEKAFVWQFRPSSIVHRQSGSAVIAALLTILLLGAIGAGMAYFVSSGQQTRIQQVTSDQAFYSNQAGMEYALGRILNEGSSSMSFPKKFSGETVNVVRAGGRITMNSAKINAREVFSIIDPSPPVVDCLTVDVSAAQISSKTRLVGVSLGRNPSCTLPLTIISMTGTTWTANNGELLGSVEIAGGTGTEFSGPAAGSGGVFSFGANTYAINDDLPHAVTYMQWDKPMTNHSMSLLFNYTYNSSSYSKTATVNITEKQSDYFQYNGAACRLVVAAGIWKRMEGCTIQNSNINDSIRITAITMSWTPINPSRNFTNMRVNGNTLINSNKANGERAVVDQTVPASTTYPIDYYLFSDEMMNYNYTTLWEFEDGSSTTSTMTLFASNQHNCLTIDTANAYINEVAAAHEIKGLTVENTCALDIGMTALTVSWTGEAGRRLTNTSIDYVDGTYTFPSNNASGVTLDFGNTDLYYLDAIGPKAIQHLRFNNAVTVGLAFTLAFTMSDGNTKSITFTPGTEAQCLTINTSCAFLGGASYVDLKDISIQNSCAAKTIAWANAVVSWSPSSSRRMTQIVVAGTTVFNNSPGANSGTTVNINPDVGLIAAQSKNIDRFRFNSDMRTRAFTIQFRMLDASTKTLSSFTPPTVDPCP